MRRAIYCVILGAVWLGGFVLIVAYLAAIADGEHVSAWILLAGAPMAATVTVALAEEVSLLASL